MTTTLNTVEKSEMNLSSENDEKEEETTMESSNNNKKQQQQRQFQITETKETKSEQRDVQRRGRKETKRVSRSENDERSFDELVVFGDSEQRRRGGFVHVDVDVDFNARVRSTICRSETRGDESTDARFD